MECGGNPGTVLLRVKGLRVQISGEVILSQINFDLEKGKTVAIVGPNGAGKTTLLRTLMGLIPYRGEITWKKGIRIGYVPQSLVRTDLPVSVAEFMNFKKIPDPEHCLSSVGLGREILNRRIGHVSGGELQRVLLAWAISDSPDILLFDEPTSLVDIGAVEPIYSKVRSLKEELEISILLITHNLHVAHHYSDYILGLNRKQLFFGNSESLSHEDLVSLMSGSSGTYGTRAITSQEGPGGTL